MIKAFGLPVLAQIVPPVESEPDLAERTDPFQRRPWFDRQGIIQAHAGFVVALIALLSSYDTSPSRQASASSSSSNGACGSSLPRWRLYLQTLNWRHNPDIEKQINASKLRTKQLESESKLIEKENARLSELNSKLEAILASAKQ